ncbi:hypothetical protein [Opitutus terrae]|uniref:Uncharacterized protein n=1 Tax=Opitutus terrae (strain DSM 11246 / JCM 15787 / PB90-1) TaxID=452637 RepID=B1ZWC0_OPITP|nr:hypothetical protein [Opitutus terrae]ACB76872.1 hypothetical protein Oter_3595 [Opitutus terrae PB90-1]
MPEIAASALDGRQRTLVENARVALERRSYAYAVEACTQVLRDAPGCLAVRRLLRQAQLGQWRQRSRLARGARVLVAWLIYLSPVSRDPHRRSRGAERVLRWHPNHVGGWLQLAGAAEALTWPGTVVFALEAVREIAPGNLGHALALGRALLAHGQPERALALANDVLAQRLLDPGAQELVRAASVALTMARGHWDPAGSFRAQLRAPATGEPVA